jgi:Icc-related predicted phosphoesterase
VHIGSRALQSAIHRTTPGLVVYGHVHADGSWRIDTDTTRYANVSVLDEQYRLVRATSEPLLRPVLAR